MNLAKTTAGQEEKDHAAHGRAVLEQEIQGLRALAGALGGEFAEAVETIAGRCHRPDDPGRLIVSGMGKSGHVGRKIAATMASTGTPAHFVHPAEASHGDLGMLTGQDCALLLSNSGETRELVDIIAHCKRFRIPLVAMVRRSGSMLVGAATVALVLPEVPEAPPIDAPTTSTIMMMALGDALAIALLKRRRFTPEEFAALHPGGRLGAAFLRVEDLMHTGAQVPLVREDAAMQHVLLEMTGKHFGCAGVVDGAGMLVGIITDGDLRRHMQPSLLDRCARDVMTQNPRTIRPDALAVEALGVMNAHAITTLFALNGEGKPAGILHIHDCLRAGVV